MNARQILQAVINRQIANGGQVIAEILPFYMPDGRMAAMPISRDEYNARVLALESDGCSTSDAQGIVDAQILKMIEGKS